MAKKPPFDRHDLVLIEANAPISLRAANKRDGATVQIDRQILAEVREVREGPGDWMIRTRVLQAPDFAALLRAAPIPLHNPEEAFCYASKMRLRPKPASQPAPAAQKKPEAPPAADPA